MKIIIEIPTQEVKQMAATVALATGNNLPENLSQVADGTAEVDITEILKSDAETQVAIQGMALVACQALIDKCEEK